MEITWYGHSCIRMMERGIASIVADPYDESIGYEVPKLKADIVTVSHDAPGHSAAEPIKAGRILSRPGEYEIGGVFITGIATYDPAAGNAARPNVAFVYQFNGTTVCHLGDLNHVPPQSQIEALGPIDVLCIPVGGGGALTSSQAAEVISMVEPAVVVPIHYLTPAVKIDLDPVEKFLKEMGVAAPPEPVQTLKITRSAEEQDTRIVLLDWQH